MEQPRNGNGKAKIEDDDDEFHWVYLKSSVRASTHSLYYILYLWSIFERAYDILHHRPQPHT